MYHMKGTKSQSQTATLRNQLDRQHALVKESCERLVQRSRKPLIVGYQTALALQHIPIPARCRNNPDIQVVNVPGLATIWKTGTTLHRWNIGSAAALVPIAPRLFAFDIFHALAQMAVSSTCEQLIIMGDAIVHALGETITEGIPISEQSRNIGEPATTIPLSEELATRLRQAEAAAQLRPGKARTCAKAESIVLKALGEFFNRPERYHGKSLCCKAYPYIAGAALSPQETRTRLALIRHGLPSPECNITVDGLYFSSGWPVTVDLAWSSAKIAIEYDGDHHRTHRTQWMNDHEKRNLLQNNDWKVFVVDAASLITEEARASFAFSVARALELRGVRTRFNPVAQSW